VKRDVLCGWAPKDLDFFENVAGLVVRRKGENQRATRSRVITRKGMRLEAGKEGCFYSQELGKEENKRRMSSSVGRGIIKKRSGGGQVRRDVPS